MRCPGEVYQNSTRPYQGTPQELIYPGMVQRRVDKNGYMSWQDQRLFLSGSLAGWSVGLKAAGGGVIEEWVSKLLVGKTFLPLRPPKNRGGNLTGKLNLTQNRKTDLVLRQDPASKPDISTNALF